MAIFTDCVKKCIYFFTIPRLQLCYLSCFPPGHLWGISNEAHCLRQTTTQPQCRWWESGMRNDNVGNLFHQMTLRQPHSTAKHAWRSRTLDFSWKSYISLQRFRASSLHFRLIIWSCVAARESLHALVLRKHISFLRLSETLCLSSCCFKAPPP